MTNFRASIALKAAAAKRVWFYFSVTWPCGGLRPGYADTYHESSDCFEYPQKNPFLTQATQKKILTKVSHPKQSQNRKFRTPKNPSNIPVTWIQSTPSSALHPTGTWDHRALGQLGNGLLEREDPGDEEVLQWRHQILDSFKQTNKKPRNYFSRRINCYRKWYSSGFTLCC